MEMAEDSMGLGRGCQGGKGMYLQSIIQFEHNWNTLFLSLMMMMIYPASPPIVLYTANGVVFCIALIFIPMRNIRRFFPF